MERFHTEAYFDQLIKSKFSYCLMNNRKWVKLLDHLVENSSLVKKSVVKLIWEEDKLRDLLLDEYTSYQFDYYDDSVESIIGGVPGGWCGYKEIEWLAFPKTIQWEGKVVLQNTVAIASLLQQIGQFELEDNPEELKLYAYK